MSIDFEPKSNWALATVESSQGPIACLEVNSHLYDLKKSLARAGGPEITSIIELFDEWQAMEPLLTKAAGLVSEVDLITPKARLAPLLFPGKVLCAGANYFRHLAEMGVENATKDNQRLFFFFKPARNAVVGEGNTVHMPLDTSSFDWEVELAVVIGKMARAVSVEDALSHVAAYTIGIDFCARDLNVAPDTFYKLDWVAGKAQNSCCPLGPRLIPASAINDPQEIALRLSVNGVQKQNDTTRDMIFTIAEQIATASRIMTLDPGDVILTGTPAGVGAAKKEFLSVGDEVKAEIQGIGTLSVIIQDSE